MSEEYNVGNSTAVSKELTTLVSANYKKAFPEKAYIAMIHLFGHSEEEIIDKALNETEIYQREGVDAIIVENYACRNLNILEKALEKVSYSTDMVVGVNILGDFEKAFDLASAYDSKFIQIDSVAGNYKEGNLDMSLYIQKKQENPDIVVLGGVWFKYYTPVEGSDMDEDLKKGMRRAEAIVCTGEGTGKETPLSKLRRFRKKLDHHPLISGAGVHEKNILSQLEHANGFIIGSYLKEGHVDYGDVCPEYVRTIKQKRDQFLRLI